MGDGTRRLGHDDRVRLRLGGDNVELSALAVEALLEEPDALVRLRAEYYGEAVPVAPVSGARLLVRCGFMEATRCLAFRALEVRIGDEPPVAAWKVEVWPSQVTVHLDAQDGGGSYPEPAGERRVSSGPITIVASF